jgi:hypothetical protein
LQQEHELLINTLKEQYENNYNASKTSIEQQLFSIQEQYKNSIVKNSEILQKEIDDQKEKNDHNQKMQNLILISVKENYELDILNLKTESNSLLEKMKFFNVLKFLTLERKNEKALSNLENKKNAEYSIKMLDREERERGLREREERDREEKDRIVRERNEKERDEREREREEREREVRDRGEEAQLEADARAAVLQVKISERTYH